MFNLPVKFGLFADYGEKYEYLGDNVEDKDCIIVSDMIDTGNSLKNFSEILGKLGARNIYYFAPHGIFSEGSMKNIKHANNVQEVIVSNTLATPEYVHDKVK